MEPICGSAFTEPHHLWFSLVIVKQVTGNCVNFATNSACGHSAYRVLTSFTLEISLPSRCWTAERVANSTADITTSVKK